jgi:hypothetical protein
VGVLARALQSPMTRIIISMVQMLRPLGGVYDIRYPPMYRDVLLRIGALELDFLSVSRTPLSCHQPSGLTFHSDLVARTLGPIGLLLALYGAAAAFRRRARAHLSWGDTSNAEKAEARHTGCATVALWLLFLAYPGVCGIIFSTFMCEEIDDGQSYLRADYSINCASPQHRAAVGYATLLLLLWPLGAPLLYAVLCQSEAELLAHQADKHEAVLARQRTKLLRRRSEAHQQGAKLKAGPALVQVREPLLQHRRRLVWLVLHPQAISWYEDRQRANGPGLPLGRLPLRGTSLTRAQLGKFHEVSLDAPPAIVMRHGEAMGRVPRPLLSAARLSQALEKAGARASREISLASLRLAEATDPHWKAEQAAADRASEWDACEMEVSISVSAGRYTEASDAQLRGWQDAIRAQLATVKFQQLAAKSGVLMNRPKPKPPPTPPPPATLDELVAATQRQLGTIIQAPPMPTPCASAMHVRCLCAAFAAPTPTARPGAAADCAAAASTTLPVPARDHLRGDGTSWHLAHHGTWHRIASTRIAQHSTA